jgi:TonB family protein
MSTLIATTLPGATPAAATISATPASPAMSPAAAAAPPLLTHSVIDRVASDHTRELSKCDGGEPMHGEVTVRFTVDASGKVVKAQVATGGGKPKVAACILRSVQKWQFPPQSATGADGTYTLSFQ